MTDGKPNEHLPPGLAELGERLLGASSGDSIEPILTELHAVSRNDSLARLLGEVLDDDRYIATELLPRSYRHALGFDKYVLISAPPSFQLRLHVWPRATHFVEEDIHNHRFSFASTVVAGELSFQTFVENPTGEMFECYRESVEPTSLSWQFEPADPLRLHPVLAGTLRPGSSYSTHRSMLHRIVPDRSVLTATLFYEGRRRSTSTSVVRARRGSDTTATIVPRMRVTTEDFRTGARQIMDTAHLVQT